MNYRRHPFLSGLFYFWFSFILVYWLGWRQGLLSQEPPTIPSMLPPFSGANLMHNINMGSLAPIGAGLLTNLYNCLITSLKKIERDNLIAPSGHAQYAHLVQRLGTLYNSKKAIYASLVFSLVWNMHAHAVHGDNWLSMNGGLTGKYARAVVFLNFFFIGLIFYKSMVTLWALERILSMEVVIRPLHPDNSGGLKPLSDIAAEPLASRNPLPC